MIKGRSVTSGRPFITAPKEKRVNPPKPNGTKRIGTETDGRAAKSACIRLVYRFRARLSSGRKLRGRRAILLKRDASCVILNRNDKCNRCAGAKAPDARGITGERETVMRKKRGWRRAAALALSAVLLTGTALALYDTGVTPEYGTQLLTLSTCGDTRPDTDARFAILAMRVG